MAIENLEIKVTHDVRQANQQLNELTKTLRKARRQVGQIEKAVGTSASPFNKLSESLKDSTSKAKKFLSSIKRIAGYRLIRFALKAVTSAIQEGIGNLYQYSKAMGGMDSQHASTTLDAFASKMLELKNAIGAAAMPVINALMPTVNALANAFIKAANAVNMFLSAVKGGTTFTKAAKTAASFGESLSGAAGAAKELKDATAGIDELNVIGQDNGGGGGGGSSIPDYSSMFTEDPIPQSFIDKLNLIKGVLIGIGAAIAALKLGQLLGLGSKITAGIALIVAGLSLLYFGIKDVIENGFNLENVLTIIAGLLAGGLGISLLTGSWIPILIAGIASALLALVYFTGNGQELLAGLGETWQGFVDLFTGLVHRDMAQAARGINEIFMGVNRVFGSVVNSIKTVFNSALDWLDEKTKGKLKPIIDYIKTIFNAFADEFKGIFEGLTTFLAGVFTGDWQKAWDGIKGIFTSVWNNIVTVFEASVNLIIKGLNWLIDKINGMIGDGIVSEALELFGVDDGHIGRIPELSLPRLATGGVVSSGQLFMANENGASELVGRFGNTAGVMNGGQIVEAVTDGVTAGVSRAMSRNSNANNTAFNLYIGGKQVETTVRKTQQRRGATIATGGIVNYAT